MDDPFGLPPFESIAPEHYKPAFDMALAEQQAQIAAIADNAEAPTFANTIEALETSGQTLKKVGGVFFNLAGSHTNDAIQAVEREMAPLLAKHRNSIFMNEALYKRVAALYDKRDSLGLNAEQARVLDRYHTIFVRAGAKLGPEEKKRLAAITERLASLGTQFSQNVLADEKSYQLVLDGEADLEGLPSFLREAAAQAAEERGLKGKHVITLSRSSIEPFLQFSKRRDLREQAFQGLDHAGRQWQCDRQQGDHRRDGGLRAERREASRLRDLRRFQARRYDGEDARQCAEAPERCLDAGHRPRRGRARRPAGSGAVEWRQHRHRAVGLALLRRSGAHGAHNLDEATIKPYFQLDRIIEAAFETAQRLFGLSFKELKDFPRYHPDIRAWQVPDAGGNPVGTFIGDYFARPSKRSGAWMSAFRSQEKARRRHPADHRQRDEFLQGRGRRAVASELRRCPHAVPRIRPRTARPALERDLSAARRHGRVDGLRRAALPALRALARNRTSCAAMQPITGPAKPIPENCSSG